MSIDKSFQAFIDAIRDAELGNMKYNKLKLIAAMAEDTLVKQFGDKEWYQEHLPDIKIIIAQAVLMAMYCENVEEQEKKWIRSFKERGLPLPPV